MCGPYWSQWNKEDLDSWQGKGLIEEKDNEPEESFLRDRRCSGCHGCMDCLGMSWKDFF